MADAFTTFLNLTNPENNASADTWGIKENTDRSTVDAMLSTLITGLTLSAAGSTATFGVAIGAAAGMVLSSAYTKTTSAWALGTAAGSLDTGAIANSTWYHVYLIQRSDTGVVDILTSLSASAPTMPTNYDRKRRIGSMKTDGSAQWVKFSQRGDEFLWDAPTKDANAVTVGATTAVLITLTVPTGVNVTPIGNFNFSYAATSAIGYVSSPDVLDQVPSVSSGAFSGAVNSAYTAVNIPLREIPRTNTSGQIRARFTAADAIYSIDTKGWIDLRGKA